MTQKFAYSLINDCTTVIEVWNFRESYITVCRLNLSYKIKNVIFDKMTEIPPIAPLKALSFI